MVPPLRIDTLQEKNIHTKLMRTSYELALNNTMPLSHFKTLVKVQRINGIHLFTVYILNMDNCKLCSQPVDRNLFKVSKITLEHFSDFEQVIKSALKKIRGKKFYEGGFLSTLIQGTKSKSILNHKPPTLVPILFN